MNLGFNIINDPFFYPIFRKHTTEEEGTLKTDELSPRRIFA